MTGLSSPPSRSGTASRAWSAARRILAVRLDNMGDVLMSTPALRALRQRRPDRSITLLASPATLVLAPFLFDVDAWIAAPLPWLPEASEGLNAMATTIENLRAQAFDAAVIFTVYSQSALPAALLCWQAGIPLRLAHCRENPYHLLSDWIADPEPHEVVRHEVRRQLDLVAAVGCTTDNEHLSFRLRATDRLSALEKLRQAGVDPARRWVVIHPGASAASRRYPIEHFAALNNLLGDMAEVQLVLTGDASEVELGETLARATRASVASLAGRLSLGELAAVIDAAALLIANNTGPVHIAAALGTPVVDIYALTNPQHAPWQVPSRVLYHDVPCRFCYRSVCPQTHHACLRLLDPLRVAQAARELLTLGAERSMPAMAQPQKLAAGVVPAAVAAGD